MSGVCLSGVQGRDLLKLQVVSGETDADYRGLNYDLVGR